MYDFREGKARLKDGAWKAPDALTPEERNAFLRLIRTWERMMLARSPAALRR